MKKARKSSWPRRRTISTRSRRSFTCPSRSAFRATKAIPSRLRSDKIDPRASLRLPHPALGADAGGALPVKPKKQKPDAKAPESELLDPCFYGTVSLIPSQSLHLHSGQRATILFSSSEQCWAGRLVMKLRKWIDDRLASSQQTS